ETDEITRLTNDYYDERDPSFGLNENQIFFSSDRTAGDYEKKYNIFSYDLSTKKIEYVTYLNSNNSSPILSPDKKKLFFTSDEDGVRNIWSLDRKSTRLNSSHVKISYAVFCLKKKINCNIKDSISRSPVSDLVC